MNIFLSYGGNRSKLLAKSLYDWLPLIFDEVRPWMADKDIDAGKIWLNEILAHLEIAHFGIICLTAENLNNKWIHYEAGALAKTLQKNKVVPYLLDLEYNEIDFPINQFQAKKAEKASTYEMLLSINNGNYSAIKMFINQVITRYGRIFVKM